MAPPPPAASIIAWAINHAERRCAAYFGGDEHAAVEPPAGFEPISPRDVLEPAAFDAWIQLGRWEQLLALCPPGYTAMPTEACHPPVG